jgi:hypothetical protein
MRRTLIALIVAASGCSASAPVALFSGAVLNPLAGPQDLHAQGGMVYWHEIVDHNTTRGPIKAMPADGGTPTVLVDIAFGDLAFDADSLYYEVADASQAGIDVMKLPLAGGAATQIAYLPTPGSWGASPVAGGYLFIMADHNPHAIVWAIRTTGGTPIQFAMMTDGDWPDGHIFVPEMVADQTNLYWLAPATNYGLEDMPDHTGGTFVKSPIAGGAPTKIGTLATGKLLGTVAQDGSAFYYAWSTDASTIPGGIDKIDAAGNDTELVSGSVNPHAMAFSGDTLYWSDLQTAPYQVLATHGPGEQQVLATGATPTHYLSVDGNRLFWLDDTTLWSLQL